MFNIPVITFGQAGVTLYALLAVLFCLAAAAAVTVRLRRRGWTFGPALLFCLISGLLGLFLGRALFFAIRNEYFLDPMGQFIGLTPLIDFSLGGVCVVGVIPGLLLGGWLTCKAFGKNTADAFDASAVPGLLLFAALSFIEPLSGQGYGMALAQPAFCWVPLGIQNGWGDWLLSVSFIEGLLLLTAAGITAKFPPRQPGAKALCALVLLSCFMILPESLRQDDALRIFVFARMTQLGYCALLVACAVLIWRRAARAGLSTGVILRETLLLILAVAVLVAAEFALDKTDWPNGLIYLAMGLVLAGTAAMLLHRIAKTRS